MTDDVVNEFEIRVFGLQRSGIHALVNWIIQQARGPTLFINDIKSLVGNPFQNADDFHWYNEEPEAGESFNAEAERSGRHLRKSYLILGYEETDFRHLPRGFDELVRLGVGTSRTVVNVVIIRDPFNLFASRFGFANSANRHPMETHGDMVSNLWKLHARECLGRTRHLGPDTVVVKYNQWFTDCVYREQIARRLGLAFTDEGLNDVPGVDLPKSAFPRFGCGSSFDNQRYHGKAQEMGVLTRWRRFGNDARYRRLFKDTELTMLCTEIFGPIPGTEAVSIGA
jgi:hypothetical protein